MKRGILLNSDISRVIASMGHTDSLVIGDAGLPIPERTRRIDLSIKAGLPSFSDVLSVVLEELCIEKVFLAEEIKKSNPEELNRIKTILVKYTGISGFQVEYEFIPHKNFKVKTSEAKAVIRTGEITPYANIILQSGVVF